MMFVLTSTSNFCAMKSAITRSSSGPFICPCAVRMRTSGRSARSVVAISSMDWTRLWMKKTCPPRLVS